MSQCQLCNYFHQPEAARSEMVVFCAVCAARTTAAMRRAYLRGERVTYSYMDSD